MVISNMADVNPKDYAFSPNLLAAFEFMKNNDLLAIPAGNTEIKGSEVYLNRSSYVGKAFEDAKIEGHSNYLDIQLVLKGVEGMGYVDKRKKGLKVTVPYDAVKDRANYDGELDGVINLHAGFFALVFPNDLHKPCIKVNDEGIEQA